MKSFSERNPLIVGAIGVTIFAVVMVGALQYKRLPFFNNGQTYSAYFTETGGLAVDAPVQISGFKIGQVTDLELDGNRVLVTFEVDKDMPLGDRTEAAIKTRTLLGSKILEVTPRGDGRLSGPIPADRTTPPYQLPDALGDVATAISGLDTNQLSDSLTTLAETFKDTPADLQVAVAGVARFSDTLGKRDQELRSLLTNASKATAVLAQRSSDVASLINDTNVLLATLQTQSGSLDAIAGHLSAVSKQLSGFVADNRGKLKPALDKLNGVLALVNKYKDNIQQSLKMLNSYAMSFGETLSSGPFFKAYLANLLPGQFVQPFIDAAFSDLGVDPNVLLPSQLADPQVGQPGTPPLPMPFPRTGQGGEPHLSLPEAITGNPGDPRYPYRPPLPAPPPGGPPPGPPAVVGPPPTPTPVLVEPGQP
ncbi:MCE family protein [Mycobacterium sp. CVI_P3]|uniref:MCE family protein n=1 Tax=Mycobacterium pinniadriaticum TaxID=2994102 RepID=A0ABT3S9X4_9MYCO|nr:MCE family protein [Mycobacterium pinniadriaticum]MCX2930035.1 MCE family protein [Mycobacterium pinniadriaticum]MCX2936316.1 MCE family protein [Mycobacterium pinniadriaticum]